MILGYQVCERAYRPLVLASFSMVKAPVLSSLNLTLSQVHLSTLNIASAHGQKSTALQNKTEWPLLHLLSKATVPYLPGSYACLYLLYTVGIFRAVSQSWYF